MNAALISFVSDAKLFTADNVASETVRREDYSIWSAEIGEGTNSPAKMGLGVLVVRREASRNRSKILQGQRTGVGAECSHRDGKSGGEARQRQQQHDTDDKAKGDPLHNKLLAVDVFLISRHRFFLASVWSHATPSLPLPLILACAQVVISCIGSVFHMTAAVSAMPPASVYFISFVRLWYRVMPVPYTMPSFRRCCRGMSI